VVEPSVVEEVVVRVVPVCELVVDVVVVGPAVVVGRVL
jgi:hypothetical protein